MPISINPKGKDVYEPAAAQLRKLSLLKPFVPETYDEAISAGIPTPAAYRLTTSIGKDFTGKPQLYVKMLNSDHPSESRTILRDLLGRMENAKAESVHFYPVEGSSKGTTPMNKMIERWVKNHNINTSPESSRFSYTIPKEEIEKFVKKSGPPKVSQETFESLNDDFLNILNQNKNNTNEYEVFDNIFKWIANKTPERGFQKNYSEASELFNLAQAKGELNF